jgi:hypothetical protein
MPVADGSSVSEIEVENGEAGFDNRRPSITMVNNNCRTVFLNLFSICGTLSLFSNNLVEAFHIQKWHVPISLPMTMITTVVNGSFLCRFLLELQLIKPPLHSKVLAMKRTSFQKYVSMFYNASDFQNTNFTGLKRLYVD